MPKPIISTEFPLDIPFPTKGLHIRTAYYAQPQLTSSSMQNVRGHDPIGQRLRGGQRSGLTKYTASKFTGAAGYPWFQDLASLTTAQSSGRSVTGLACVGGNLYFFANGTLGTGYATQLIATLPVVFSTTLNQTQYYADGTNFVQMTLAAGAASWALQAGSSYPTDGSGNGPRLLETWRARIMAAGIYTMPQNAFGSAVGDATDWNYSPTPSTETQAFELQNTEAGIVGDIINCMIPWSDDVLIWGCDSSIWQMTGDPMAGGRNDLITSKIGMAWGRPWCRGPDGTLYFFSSRNSIYRLVVGGGAPERMSYPIDPLLTNVGGYATNIVKMVYDDTRQGFHVMITPWAVSGNQVQQPTSTQNWWYDAVNDAWFPDVFGNTWHNPLAVLAYEADGDHKLLLGGQDGYLRFFDDTSASDDGTAISSSVQLGPIRGDKQEAFLLKDLQCVLDSASGSVTFTIMGDASAQIASNGASRFNGTFHPGRNSQVPCRLNGVAFYVTLAQDTNGQTWALESLIGHMRNIGKVRQRLFVGQE